MSDEPDDPGLTATPEPTPARRVLDLLVFAPVGVALTVVEELPTLIVKGRQRVETDVRNARVIGKFVVTQGQRDVSRRVAKLFSGGRSAPSSDPTAAAPPDDSRRPTGATGSTGETTASPGPAPPASSPQPNPADGVIVDGALADYDTLSASQVVRRLESLGPEELRAVHRYEASHRNRRTILNRAQQLLDGTGAHGATPAPVPEVISEPDRPDR